MEARVREPSLRWLLTTGAAGRIVNGATLTVAPILPQPKGEDSAAQVVRGCPHGKVGEVFRLPGGTAAGERYETRGLAALRGVYVRRLASLTDKEVRDAGFLGRAQLLEMWDSRHGDALPARGDPWVWLLSWELLERMPGGKP